jgi:transposase-like protein
MPTRYKRSTKPRTTPTGKKAPPTGTAADLNAMTMAGLFADEDKAREFLESQRWPDGPVCPHCGSVEAYRLTAKPGSTTGVRKGVCKCKYCRKQFTVKVGTVFEDSKLPLRYWLYVAHLMTSSKKGVSSHQIARELEITVKSAWFMTMRLREAMKQEPVAGMLKGEVEVDEVYMGGKPRHTTIHGKGGEKKVVKRGRGTNKQAVLVLVERNGAVIATPLYSPSSIELKAPIRDYVDKCSTIFSDEFVSYKGIGNEFIGGHETVNHQSKEYVRYEENYAVHNNTAESFNALLKRGHYGIFHHLSKKHLERYLDEFAFRWKHRKTTDGQRMVAALDGADGKRLMYRQPVGKFSAGLVASEKV